MAEAYVGVLGATSLVGEFLLSRLRTDGWKVMAFSRREPLSDETGVEWRQLSFSDPFPTTWEEIHDWISVSPIWVLPEYFSMLESCGARRVVVLSSTSRFTKTDSSDAAECAIAEHLAEGEECFRTWAESRGIEWVILRPTLIYGRGKDRNIAEITRFIRRFGVFPLLGKAMGLRQPIHAEDVAAACVGAMNSPVAANRAYNISGGETLPYREIVLRVFTALQRRPRLVTIPLIAFKFAVACLRAIPRYRSWSAAMAERMNRDLVFDHSDATRDFGFSPRPFQLAAEDMQ